MGDKNENVSKISGESKEENAAGNNDGRPSFELLKETKELADITNVESVSSAVSLGEKKSKKKVDDKPKEVEDKKSEKSLKSENVAKVETVFENTKLDLAAASEAPLKQTALESPQESTVPNETSGNTGRMNKIRDHNSTIFPAGTMGCTENGNEMASPRRFLDAFEASKDSVGHVASIPRKMSNTKWDQKRNPLTGTGVDSSDTLKRTASKKKVDGNPLLGVGYIENKASTSSTRIPPGGFSHGLW